MEARWLSWITALSPLVIVLLGPILYALWHNVKVIRENELHEIHLKLSRIEEKLDRHLEWHSQ